MQAAERVFKPVGINVILACYPGLNTQVGISLHYATDASAASSPGRVAEQPRRNDAGCELDVHELVVISRCSLRERSRFTDTHCKDRVDSWNARSVRDDRPPPVSFARSL